MAPEDYSGLTSVHKLTSPRLAGVIETVVLSHWLLRLLQSSLGGCCNSVSGESLCVSFLGSPRRIPSGWPGGMNLCGYAGGDPINFPDPFGFCPEWLTGTPCGLTFSGQQFSVEGGSESLSTFDGATTEIRVTGGVRFIGGSLSLVQSLNGRPTGYSIGVGLTTEQGASAHMAATVTLVKVREEKDESNPE